VSLDQKKKRPEKKKRKKKRRNKKKKGVTKVSRHANAQQMHAESVHNTTL